MKKSGMILACAVATHVWGNPAHNQIYAMQEDQRQSVFARLLAPESAACATVSRTFYQGTDGRGTAYWNAQCKGKKIAYVVQITNNATGSTRLLDCALLKAAKAPACFTKF